MLDLFNYLGWFVGGSTIAMVVLAVFARPIFDLVVAFFQPILAGLGDILASFGRWVFLSFLPWLFRTLKEGIKDIVDNLNTVITVLLLLMFTYLYASWSPTVEIPDRSHLEQPTKTSSSIVYRYLTKWKTRYISPKVDQSVGTEDNPAIRFNPYD